MNYRQAYQQTLRARLEIWGAEISRIEAGTAPENEVTDLARHPQVVNFRGERHCVAGNMDSPGSASDDAWRDIRRGIGIAWRNLENALRSALSRRG